MNHRNVSHHQERGGRHDARPHVPRVNPEEDHHWLTRPSTVRLMWWVFGIILTLTVVAQWLIPVKGAFPVEGVFAFGAWYGFLACLAMVLVAKVLGWVLKRPEDYYGEADISAGDEEHEDA